MKFGRPKKEVPDDFAQLVLAWERGNLLLPDVLRICGVSESTFYRRLRQYRKERDGIQKGQ